MNNHNVEHQCKLNLLADRFLNENTMYNYEYDYYGNKIYSLNRKTLKEHVCGALEIHEQHTVNGWIDEIIGLGWFTHNPTSERTKAGYIRPSNDSRYIIHLDKITHAHIDSFK